MSPENIFLGEVGQKAIIERDGKVLMVHAVGEPGWDFPGGKLHLGEEMEEGLLRELREELGITHAVVGAPLQTIATTSKSGTPKIMIVYVCSLPHDSQFQLKTDEIADVTWVGEEDVSSLETHPAWREVLERYFKMPPAP